MAITLIDTQRQIKKQQIINTVVKVVVYTFLTIMAVYMIVPFYWMLITSLKSATEVRMAQPTLFPQEIIWQNYPDALERANLFLYFINTIIVSLATTLIGTFLTIFVAFSLSRLKFFGRDIIFTILLATMMIPGEMMVVTNFITVANLGWVGGSRNAVPFGPYYAMIIPFLVSIFHVYLLRQNFKQIPNELYYAAKVDGTSDWKYLWRVMVPMSKASIVTIIILRMMGAWNSFVWPNLVAGEKEKLITNGLRAAFSDSGTGMVEYQYQMAATVMVTIPLVLVFIFFRKYIMKGVSRSGIKG